MSTSHTCGMCGACGQAPRWSPEVITTLPSAEKIAVLKRLKHKQDEFKLQKEKLQRVKAASEERSPPSPKKNNTIAVEKPSKETQVVSSESHNVHEATLSHSLPAGTTQEIKPPEVIPEQESQSEAFKDEKQQHKNETYKIAIDVVTAGNVPAVAIITEKHPSERSRHSNDQNIDVMNHASQPPRLDTKINQELPASEKLIVEQENFTDFNPVPAIEIDAPAVEYLNFAHFEDENIDQELKIPQNKFNDFAHFQKFSTELSETSRAEAENGAFREIVPEAQLSETQTTDAENFSHFETILESQPSIAQKVETEDFTHFEAVSKTQQVEAPGMKQEDFTHFQSMSEPGQTKITQVELGNFDDQFKIMTNIHGDTEATQEEKTNAISSYVQNVFDQEEEEVSSDQLEVENPTGMMDFTSISENDVIDRSSISIYHDPEEELPLKVLYSKKNQPASTESTRELGSKSPEGEMIRKEKEMDAKIKDFTAEMARDTEEDDDMWGDFSSFADVMKRKESARVSSSPGERRNDRALSSQEEFDKDKELSHVSMKKGVSGAVRGDPKSENASISLDESDITKRGSQIKFDPILNNFGDALDEFARTSSYLEDGPGHKLNSLRAEINVVKKSIGSRKGSTSSSYLQNDCTVKFSENLLEEAPVYETKYDREKTLDTSICTECSAIEKLVTELETKRENAMKEMNQKKPAVAPSKSKKRSAHEAEISNLRNQLEILQITVDYLYRFLDQKENSRSKPQDHDEDEEDEMEKYSNDHGGEKNCSKCLGLQQRKTELEMNIMAIHDALAAREMSHRSTSLLFKSKKKVSHETEIANLRRQLEMLQITADYLYRRLDGDKSTSRSKS